MGKALKVSGSGGKKDKNLRFNSNGSSTLATLFAVASAVVMVAIIGFLFQISNRVNDINTGKVADGRLTDNVAHYNDPAPTFKHYVKAPGFVGNLVGNADTATALTADPMDCATGTFATAIDAQGNLYCEVDGSSIVNVNAVTVDGHSAEFFQNASNLTSGTVSDARLSSRVTMQGNTFNAGNTLVLLNADGSLPALNASNLYNLNAGALAFGTVADARLSANVAKYNDATPTFVNSVTAPVFNGNLNGNATTATALAADPADCAIGAYANAINSTGDLTCSTDGAALVNLDAGNITTGTLADARLSANVTMQGNTFNGANQLVQLDATGALPALDGAALTNLTGANVTGTVANAQDAVNFTGVLAGDVTGTQGATVVSNVSDTALSANVALLDGTNGLDFTGAGTLTADAFVGDGSGLTNITVANATTATSLAADPTDCAAGEFANAIDAQANLTCSNDGSSLINLTGANVTGTVANATDAVNFTGALAGDVTGTQGATVVSNVNDSALSANVTMQGNTFNGADQLVQLDAAGALRTLDGAALTNLTGANVTGVVANATDSVNFTGALAGDVTGTQGATVVSNVNDTALSTNVALLDGTNGLTFTGALSATSLSGDGAGLTNLTGANVTGSVALADALTVDPSDCSTDTYANSIDANGNLGCAAITDASLSANVTLMGNTFNGADQLVQLGAGGELPVLNAGNLTNLTGGNVQGDITGNASGVTGTISDANVADNLTINGGTINNTVIGGATPAAGTFTSLNTGTFTSTGSATVDSLAVTNSATVGNALTVTGVTTLNGVTTINNSLTVTGSASLSTVTISGTSTHTGAATFNGTATFNNTLTGNAAVNFSGASSMRAPVTAVAIVNGVTACGAAGSGALTFSTNGNFYGCDGAVWRQLNN